MDANILAVDDTPENLHLLCGLLREAGHTVRPVPSGELALQAAAAERPDLILLDIAMPGMDGFEVCKRIKADPSLAEVPVVFLTAHTDVSEKVEAFAVGGVDYVTKPFQTQEILARVATHATIAGQQRELRESYERLVELERMRDTLVHMIVHDLRSPLSVVVALLDFVKQEVDDAAPSVSTDLAECSVAVARIIEMVTAVLDVSKLEAGAMSVECGECDLAAIAREVVASMRALTVERSVVVEPATGAVMAIADPSLVPRVIQNLLSNAIRFTPRGGTITVTATHDGDVARLAIRDEGPGVPEASREKIFEKFGALDRAAIGRPSTGLGLPFCRMAVEAQLGAIGVSCEEGQRGSTFWFTLPSRPLAEDSPEPDAPADT